MAFDLSRLGLSRGKLPLVVAPMFLVSGVDMVTTCCRSGAVGSFPALNHRTSEGFEEWVETIKSTLAAEPSANPVFGVNLTVHSSNPRLGADLDICVRQKVPLIVTSLGAVPDVVERVHGYGGLVFHDVVNMRHARNAISAGVDGLVLVCAGAGGHGGQANPFAFIEEARREFDGAIGLAGGITTGRGVAAAVAAGADFAYVGTHFITTTESMAPDRHKEMMIGAEMADIIHTDAISGVPGNFLRQSLVAAGIDPARLTSKEKIDFGAELKPGSKVWKDIWAAGQGVGGARTVTSAAEVIARMRSEYRQTLEAMCVPDA